jgi:hypothetical protein
MGPASIFGSKIEPWLDKWMEDELARLSGFRLRKPKSRGRFAPASR